jgi:catechol 2,3-dioxygenase-like lactoylglutathione lyase family enzyme
MTQPTLGTDQIIQVGLVVADVEKTASAWSALLGLPMPEITLTDELDFARTEYKGAPTTARAKLAFFHMGQVDIELIEPVGEPSTWNDQLQQYGSGLHHIALEVAGMGERLKYLDAQGVKLVQRGEYVGGRYAYFDTHGQLGAVLELLEHDKP